MHETQWEDFWWNNITGAQTIVEKVVDALLSNNMVVLQVPSDLPWRHSMRGAISTAFQGRSASREIIIDSWDMADDNPESIDPGKFILEKYATREIRNSYRERSGVKIQDYISRNEVIKNRILWIKGLSKSAAQQWIKFCQDYSSQASSPELFVVEIHETCRFTRSRNLKFINYSDSVSSYDVQLFNSFMLDSDYGQYSDVWKSYVSTVAAQVCGTDAEVSEFFIRSTDFKNEDVFESIQRISENPEFAKRGVEIESKHVLWEMRNNRTDQIKHRIWVAQVQVLFPIIEVERVRIIRMYKGSIQEALENYHIEQYGQQITDVSDVELGTLIYMMSRRDSEGMRVLYIPDEGLRSRIYFLHDCRNALAHAECCTVDQVRELIDAKAV